LIPPTQRIALLTNNTLLNDNNLQENKR